MLARVPLPPSQAHDDELRSLRQRIDELTAANAQLQLRLDLGEQARTDLLDQSRHLLELIAKLQRDLAYHRQQPS